MCTLRYEAFYQYTATAEIRRLHIKRRVVIASAEFGGKQSPETGPRALGSYHHAFYAHMRAIWIKWSSVIKLTCSSLEVQCEFQNSEHRSEWHSVLPFFLSSLWTAQWHWWQTLPRRWNFSLWIEQSSFFKQQYMNVSTFYTGISCRPHRHCPWVWPWCPIKSSPLT